MKKIKADINGKIDLNEFKEPIVIKMGIITKVIFGKSETIYYGKKQHTKKPFININGELYEVESYEKKLGEKQ